MPPKAVTFALVQQSYENPNFDGRAELVPASQVKNNHRVKGGARRMPILFGEDLPEHLEDEFRMNLRVADDSVDDKLFDDEVEEDFDENFIRQIMTGEGVEGFNFDDDDDMMGGLGGDGDDGEGDGDEDARLAAVREQIAKYPKHEERGVGEKQFDRMMADFDADANIDEDDVRVRGSLPVTAYGAALEQFANDNAGENTVFLAATVGKKNLRNDGAGAAAAAAAAAAGDDNDDDDGSGEAAPRLVPGVPMRHRGFIQQLSIMARNNQEFAPLPDGRGHVLTGVTDKRLREMEEFLAAAAEMRRDMRQALERSEVHEEDITVAAQVAAAVASAMRPDGSIAPDDPRSKTRKEVQAELPPFVREQIEAAERRSERVDCETVLTTLTSTFNLPNIIAVDRTTRRLKPQKGGALRKTMQEERRQKKLAKEQQRGQGAQSSSASSSSSGFRSDDDDDEQGDRYHDEDDMPDEAMTADALSLALRDQRIALSTVPADETAEQKKARKALVKQMQREARAVKKVVKGEFKKQGKELAVVNSKAQSDKRTATLSSIRGNMVVQ